ncbi:MAG TPA: hypothetical protein VMV45_21285 [Casimicrobiaceae bacterium]|nr:hypothetical protein [Casimicrobiaceae bacterium]
MNRKLKALAGVLTATGLAVGTVVPAIAGMDTGDSSMNPFTGDSYAYFHGGHNAGEQAMIIPGRTPAAQRSFERRFAQDRLQAQFRSAEPAPQDRNAQTPPVNGSGTPATGAPSASR